MKAEERDKLLTQVAEQNRNIWRMVEKMEKHQAEQNGYIRENLIVGQANSTWILAFRWAIGGIIAILGFFWTKLEGLW